LRARFGAAKFKFCDDSRSAPGEKSMAWVSTQIRTYASYLYFASLPPSVQICSQLAAKVQICSLADILELITARLAFHWCATEMKAFGHLISD
jgi:hypothetical protein